VTNVFQDVYHVLGLGEWQRRSALHRKSRPGHQPLGPVRHAAGPDGGLQRERIWPDGPVDQGLLDHARGLRPRLPRQGLPGRLTGAVSTALRLRIGRAVAVADDARTVSLHARPPLVRRQAVPEIHSDAYARPVGHDRRLQQVLLGRVRGQVRRRRRGTEHHARRPLDLEPGHWV
jgi:hypothetical protein